MEITQWVLIPLLLGLIGFIEPCSIGANILFLNYINKLNKRKAWIESILFTFSRSFLLGSIGLLTAFFGKKTLIIQDFYNYILGILFIIIGLLYVFNKHKRINWPSLNLNKFLTKSPNKSILMGVLFGLSAPACTTPLLILLIGQSAHLTLLQGFISLFAFGIALSFPLLLISRLKYSIDKLKLIGNWASRIPFVIGMILIIIGIFTFWQGM